MDNLIKIEETIINLDKIDFVDIFKCTVSKLGHYQLDFHFNGLVKSFTLLPEKKQVVEDYLDVDRTF